MERESKEELEIRRKCDEERKGSKEEETIEKKAGVDAKRRNLYFKTGEGVKKGQAEVEAK
jgi:hypothetical protein